MNMEMNMEMNIGNEYWMIMNIGNWMIMNIGILDMELWKWNENK